METGFKNVQQKIWNMTNSVNDKKVLLFTTDTKPVDLSMVNVDTRSSSMIKPQNFHKKLDFPSFESGGTCFILVQAYRVVKRCFSPMMELFCLAVC